MTYVTQCVIVVVAIYDVMLASKPKFKIIK